MSHIWTLNLAHKELNCLKPVELKKIFSHWMRSLLIPLSAAFILLFLIEQIMQSEIVGVGLPPAGFISNIISRSVGVDEVPIHPTYSCPVGKPSLQITTAGTPFRTRTHILSACYASSRNWITALAGNNIDMTGVSNTSSKDCPAGYLCPAGATSKTANLVLQESVET